MKEAVIATWPGGYRLVRALDLNALYSLTEAENYRRKILLSDQEKEIEGSLVQLFVVQPDGRTVLQLRIELDGVHPTYVLRRPAKRESLLEVIYGFYRSLTPFLGPGFSVNEKSLAGTIEELEITPIDPGPPSPQFDTSSFRLLSVPEPWLWPLEQTRTWYMEQS